MNDDVKENILKKLKAAELLQQVGKLLNPEQPITIIEALAIWNRGFTERFVNEEDRMIVGPLENGE